VLSHKSKTNIIKVIYNTTIFSIVTIVLTLSIISQDRMIRIEKEQIKRTNMVDLETASRFYRYEMNNFANQLQADNPTLKTPRITDASKISDELIKIIEQLKKGKE
jgi:hypothetical protein